MYQNKSSAVHRIVDVKHCDIHEHAISFGILSVDLPFIAPLPNVFQEGSVFVRSWNFEYLGRVESFYRVTHQSLSRKEGQMLYLQCVHEVRHNLIIKI